MEVPFLKRSLGINFGSDGQADVLLWAPKAKHVALYLPHLLHTIPLQEQPLGYWQIRSPEVSPGDRYYFLLDGELQRPDPASLSQPEGVHGPSRAVDLPAYAWQDQHWHNHPLDDYILYELHTGTFTPEGTFAALEQKLDYLVELGITAVELMPVGQFPGARNWGYDGVLPFAVQESYGGPEGLQHLVDACHQKGLAVVLDVVYNHIGPEGNYLADFAPYFTDKYKTPWGAALNFDDAGCHGVRRYFIENLLMFLRDFHIDAVRMDAVHAIKDFSPTHLLRQMRQLVDQLMQETGRTHYLIVELDLNDTRFINPLDQQGYGMDAQWIDEFHHALRVTSGGDRSGYYADFDGLAHLAKAYKDAYVYDGQYSPHRDKYFGIKTEQNPGRQFVVFSQNHDQVGNRMLGERSSQLVSFEMQKLLAGAVLVSPYLPMLFMGEEYGETHPFLYFVSHTDPELAEAVRKGRKAEFAAFHTEGEAPDPMAESTFEESKLQWYLVGQPPHRVLLEYYQRLISLRKELPPLRHPDRTTLHVEHNDEQQTLRLHRWHGYEEVLCLLNFSKVPQTITLPVPTHSWLRVLDSAASRWNGPSAGVPAATDDDRTVVLAPESIQIHTLRHA
jgi:maltooligosyltrehalose trehalohydrolase